MKITPITKARRAREVEVEKLVCDCDAESWLFRVTQAGDQVFCECAVCLCDHVFLLAQPRVPEDPGEACP
jgi:hypothetical protein